MKLTGSLSPEQTYFTVVTVVTQVTKFLPSEKWQFSSILNYLKVQFLRLIEKMEKFKLGEVGTHFSVCHENFLL